MLGKKNRLKMYFNKAESHCKQSIDKYGKSETYLSINIHHAKTVLNSLRIYHNIDSKREIPYVANCFYRLEDEIKQAQHNEILSEKKALGWLSAIYAGLSGLYRLESSNNYEMYKQKYFKTAVELFKISSQKLDFFFVEPVYKLPFQNNLDEMNDFIKQIKMASH